MSSADAVAALHDLVSPVSAFIRDHCDRGGEVAVDLLYRRWRAWCEDNGHQPSSQQIFGKDLRAVVPALRVARPRFDGDRERRYVGVSLRAGPTSGRVADHRGPGASGTAVVRDGPRPHAFQV